MKQNKLKYLLLSAIISLSAQNAMASASAAAALEAEEGIPGLEGQTIRVSMQYNGNTPASTIRDLSGFSITLPGGIVEKIFYIYDLDLRIPVDENFDVSGLTSFPVTLTYDTEYTTTGEDGETLETAWGENENIQCTKAGPKDMPTVEAIRIFWDADGKCSLSYKYKHVGPKTKAARSS